MLRTTERIIAIGASTGGTKRSRSAGEMPPDAPPVIISQHIPAAFNKSFAERMNRISPMAVCEAQDGQPISGRVSRRAIDICSSRGGARAAWQRPARGSHRPSVDVMFRPWPRTSVRTPWALLKSLGDNVPRLKNRSGRQPSRGTGHQCGVGNARIGRKDRCGDACPAAATHWCTGAGPGRGGRRGMT
jgi:hypothetical protein